MLDQAELDGLVGIPEELVGELLDASPGALACLVLDEVLPEVLAVESLPLSRGPGGEVDTIGHVAHVELFGEEARPDGGEHLLRYPSVEQAHTVGLLTGVQGKDAHGELLVAPGMLPSEVYELMP